MTLRDLLNVSDFHKDVYFCEDYVSEPKLYALPVSDTVREAVYNDALKSFVDMVEITSETIQDGRLVLCLDPKTFGGFLREMRKAHLTREVK